MPVINNVGQSAHTDRKQEGLEKILDIHTQIVRSIVHRPSCRYADNSYLFCDMNAGPGRYNQTHGSPLVFSSVAQRNNINYIAIFSEISETNSAELYTNLGCESDGNAFNYSCEMLKGSNVIGCSITNGGVEIVCNESNTKTLKSVTNIYTRKGSKYPYGFVYVDPNNHEGRFVELKAFFDNYAFRFLDILIHISGTSIKRIARANQSERLIEMLAPINKKYWLVQEPDTSFHWTFLLGTNWNKYPEYPQLNLVYADSPQGRKYLNQINYTKEELRQMENGQLPHG